MLVEQIIEIEFRGPGPPVLLYLVYFMIKQKSLRKIFESIIIYC